MPRPRNGPFVRVSWISGLLSGEKSCEWAAWFRAHNFYTKRPDDFDSAGWRIKHTSLLVTVRDQFRTDGYTVTVEDQNDFKVSGAVGVLAEKPDLIAVKGDHVVVIDAKTGTPRASDTAQVMTYMRALPFARPRQFKGLKIDGMVVYQTRQAKILADDVDDAFRARIRSLMQRICGTAAPFTSPSVGDCRYCDISQEDCSDRAGGGIEEEIETTNEF